MCCGLSGSGKSTWARDMQKTHPGEYVRINQDEIRRSHTELFDSQGNYQFSKENEQVVSEDNNRQVIEALSDNQSVIVDNTNLTDAHFARYKRIADQLGVEFKMQYFRTSIAECIRRDALRTGSYDKAPGHGSVGAKVIYEQAARRTLYDPHIHETYVPRGTAAVPAIMCDLDGTLAARHEGRDWYDASTCDQDHLVSFTHTLLWNLSGLGWVVIYLTGRHDRWRVQTQTFLDKFNCPKGELFMRETGDNRTDWKVKGELFSNYVRGSNLMVKACFDDRNQVVNYWRSIGLTCHQVAAGDF